MKHHMLQTSRTTDDSKDWNLIVAIAIIITTKINNILHKTVFFPL